MPPLQPAVAVTAAARTNAVAGDDLRGNPPSARRRFWRGVGVAGWFALMLLIPVVLSRDAGVPATEGWRVAVGTLPLATLYTLMLLAAARMAARFPVGATVWKRRLLAHVATAAGFGVALAVVERLVTAWSPAIGTFTFPVVVILNASLYALLAGGAHAAEYARRYRRAEAEALRLRAELNETARQRAEAELRVLKAELNPHFLGNALHVVATLTRTDRVAAVQMLDQLDVLLRDAVERAHTQQVTLAEELTQLEPFLAIERARLGGALEMVWNVAPDSRAARIPHLLLQPLVENAVRHGLAPRGGGRIIVATRRRPHPYDALEVTVTDDGVGLAAAEAARGGGFGVGLANGRARLAALYGSAATMTLERADGGGTVARVVVPWNVSDDARSATLRGAAPVAAPGTTGDRHDVRPHLFAHRSRRRRLSQLALPAWFAAVWLLWTQLARAVLLEDGRKAAPSAAVFEGFVAAVLWTTILVVAVRLTRRAPVAGRHAVRHLTRHLGAAGALAVFVGVSKLLVSTAFGYPLPAALIARLAGGAVATMSFYALLTAAAHAVEYARRDRRAESARLLLRDRLTEAARRRAEAELHALKTELNPQLLGSTVRTAASLVPTDPDGAVRVLAHLGTMVRDALLRTRVQEVTLEEEMIGLEPFLEVARTPIGSHAVVEWDVDPTTLGARVPHLILQPLLAGALRDARGATGAVRIVARRAGPRLEVDVTGAPHRAADRAADRPPDAPAERDNGLTNARARLAELYADDADLVVEAAHGARGTVARLRLPFVHDDAADDRG